MISTDCLAPIAPPPRSLSEDFAAEAECYAITLFTHRWRDVREFYVEILGARVTGERHGRYTELLLGGLPICLRQSEAGETVSFFHLYLALKNPQPILSELRNRGIIVTNVGPYTNFRDPEGRVIKLSSSKMIMP